MADKDDLIVDGFFFGSFDDAKQANKEIKNANYLNERVVTMNTRQKKALYDKILDDKVFSTPVGWEYLRYLRNSLIEEGITEEELRPIPLYLTFTSSSSDNNKMEHIAKMYVKPNKKDLLNKTKYNLRISVFINILLIVIVIAMFIITMNSSSPNIINYKTTILNQYSEWEQNLQKKEKELNEKEKALEEKESDYENFGG